MSKKKEKRKKRKKELRSLVFEELTIDLNIGTKYHLQSKMCKDIRNDIRDKIWYRGEDEVEREVKKELNGMLGRAIREEVRDEVLFRGQNTTYKISFKDGDKRVSYEFEIKRGEYS